MFRVEYGEISNSGWAYRDFVDFKPAARFIEDFYNRADDVMRKRSDLRYWANILSDIPEDADDFDVDYVTHFEEPEIYIDVLEKGNSLNPIKESMKTIPSRKHKTVEELFNKLENEFGEDFGNFHYFTKDNVDLGTEMDLEEKYGIIDWYDLEVLDYRPGYYEYIITLNLNSKDLHIRESLNNKRRNKLIESKTKLRRLTYLEELVNDLSMDYPNVRYSLYTKDGYWITDSKNDTFYSYLDTKVDSYEINDDQYIVNVYLNVKDDIEESLNNKRRNELTENLQKGILPQDLSKAIEDLGWSVKDTYIENWSPAGGDMIIGWNEDEDAVEEIKRYCRNYDVADEFNIYNGHLGRGGVPSSARELLADCEDKKEMYDELYNTVVELGY